MSIGFNPNEIFDKDRIMEQIDNDTELLVEIIDLFIASYPKLVISIKNAINQNDSKSLQRSAHALKGSIGNFASDIVYNIALDLEIMGRDNDMPNAKETCIKLEREIEKLRLALDMYRKEIDP
jgi:HPt (histidine-containing phosphotransfer) domain-containing protein